MIRILDHEALLELAEHATVPVINGLTQRSHPCQVMADVLTFEEHRGPIAGRKLAWIGRRQQRARLAGARRGALRLPPRRRRAARARRRPPSCGDWVERERRRACASSPIRRRRSPTPIASSPTPGSRWGTRRRERRHNLLKRYQVNARLLEKAKPDTIFMHCLPAHRGEEVTAEVIDGPQSVVFDEAENRLHAQKGILAWCLGGGSMMTMSIAGFPAGSSAKRRPRLAVPGGGARRARPRGHARRRRSTRSCSATIFPRR